MAAALIRGKTVVTTIAAVAATAAATVLQGKKQVKNHRQMFFFKNIICICSSFKLINLFQTDFQLFQTFFASNFHSHPHLIFNFHHILPAEYLAISPL
jgi:hypothetical protein